MLETISGKYTIKQIFKENWNWFYDKHCGNIRSSVIENVNKVVNCGDKDKLGWSLYACAKCGHKHYVAHTCKSRFCNSCGKVMTDSWIGKSEKEFFNVPYHHLAFSPPVRAVAFFPLLPRVPSVVV